MSWLSYVFPRTVLRFSSDYNHDIRVVEEHGVYKLLVYGSRQSGEYIKKLWQTAFSDFGIIPSPDVKNILVLGVAGGTVIHMLHAMYPDAIITGVDIDEKMIAVGKKYFGLDAILNLVLKQDDAKKFINRATDEKKKWDLIIIDVFIGASIPPFVGEHAFLFTVKQILSSHGIVVINYLREYEYEKLSDFLFIKLRRVFSEVRDTKIYFNRFFFCM